MKKLLTLLLFTTLFVSCSSDDDNNGPDEPEIPKTESLKGQTFSGFFSSYDNGDDPAYDMYRTYSFTSDKEFTEYATRDAVDGDVIAEYKGTYSYKHPNLVLTITRVGIEMEHQATMNDVKSEFSYPISDGKLIFKKK